MVQGRTTLSSGSDRVLFSANTLAWVRIVWRRRVLRRDEAGVVVVIDLEMQGRRGGGRVYPVCEIKEIMGLVRNDLNEFGTVKCYKGRGPKSPGMCLIGLVLTRPCRGVHWNVAFQGRSRRKKTRVFPMPECPFSCPCAAHYCKLKVDGLMAWYCGCHLNEHMRCFEDDLVTLGLKHLRGAKATHGVARGRGGSLAGGEYGDVSLGFTALWNDDRKKTRVNGKAK